MRPKGPRSAYITDNGSMSYSVYLDADTYNLSFLAAQRAKNRPRTRKSEVLVDGAQVGSDHARPAPTLHTFTRRRISRSPAGTHTIQFIGMSPQTANSTAFIDEVSLAAAENSLSDGSFERRSWPRTPTRPRPAVPPGSSPETPA